MTETNLPSAAPDVGAGTKHGYALHGTTNPALERMRAHDAPYDIDVAGVNLRVLPGVWSPAYDWSGRFHVEHLPEVKGLDVLEIGCGIGLISVFAAIAGARRVVAVDINPAAVENANLNFARLGLKQASAQASDLFSSVGRRFHFVIWNAPYHGSKPRDMLERACSDENYQSLRAFFAQVGSHLEPGGIVQLGFSTSGDLELLMHLIEVHGFVVVRRLNDVREGYNCEVFDLKAARVA